MKKRMLSLLLALVLMLSPAPAALAYDGQTPQIDWAPAQQDAALMESAPAVTGWEELIPYPDQAAAAAEEEHLYGASVDEEQVYQTLIGLRSVYYEGLHWTDDDNAYTLSVPVYDEKENAFYTSIGHGCVAFCYLLSDAAFGSLSARKVYSFTYDDVRVGDILRVNGNTHSVTVLEKHSSYVVLAEANVIMSPNSEGVVHWDRTMSRAEVMKADHITTRYPSPSPSPTSIRLSVDKATVSPDERVKVSIRSPISSTYNIQIWKGARGSGQLVSASDNISPSSSFLFSTSRVGSYTAYAEALNADGQLISGIVTFTVSDGRPSNVKLTADRSVFVVGEPFCITVTAADMTGFNLELWRGEYGTGTLIDNKKNVSPNERVKITLNSAGRYTLYAEAYNNHGKTTATMSVNAVDSTGSVPFTDVPANAYYADAVDWAVIKGITVGTSATTFSPNATVTRGEAVTFLWRAMGKPGLSGSYTAFKDVSPSDYYFQAVQWAEENGITVGTGDGCFSPGGAVTRGQMITFLWRTQGKPDAAGQGEWYTDAENWARSKSLLSGTSTAYATDLFCPRSDVVYYMWNALS